LKRLTLATKSFLTSRIFFVLAARGSYSVFSLIFVVIFGIVLNVDDFAFFALLESIKIFVVIVPCTALSQALIKNHIKNKSITSLHAGFLLHFILLVLFVLLMLGAFGINILFDGPNMYWFDVFAFTIYVITLYFYLLAKTVWLSFDNLKNIAVMDSLLLMSFLIVIYTTNSLINDWDVSFSLINLSAAFFITAFVSWVQIFRSINIKKDIFFGKEIKSDIQFQLHYFKFSFVNNLSTNSLNIIDSMLVYFFLGSYSTALYKASKVLLSAFVIIGDLFYMLLFPRLCQYSLNDYNTAEEILVKSLKQSFLWIFLISVFIVVYGADVLNIVYNGRYDFFEISLFVQLIGVYGLVLVFVRIYSIFVSALGYPDILMKSSLMASVGLVACISIFIPLYGLNVIPIVLIFSAIFIALYNYNSINKLRTCL
jgi:O-antigen/teichoic acid export membrane protein